MPRRPTGSTAPARARIEGAIASLGWRAETVGAWLALLARIGGPADPEFVDWLAVDRVEGREYDVGLHRHWLDPDPALRRDRARARARRAGHLGDADARAATGTLAEARDRRGPPRSAPATRFEAASPFDYAAQAEVLIVTDVKRGDLPALANAYARLIVAAERRHARAVHRDPAAARRPCPHRRPARARGPAAPTPSMSIRSIPARWSISSATIRAPR